MEVKIHDSYEDVKDSRREDTARMWDAQSLLATTVHIFSQQAPNHTICHGDCLTTSVLFLMSPIPPTCPFWCAISASQRQQDSSRLNTPSVSVGGEKVGVSRPTQRGRRRLHSPIKLSLSTAKMDFLKSLSPGILPFLPPSLPSKDSRKGKVTYRLKEEAPGDKFQPRLCTQGDDSF